MKWTRKGILVFLPIPFLEFQFWILVRFILVGTQEKSGIKMIFCKTWFLYAKNFRKKISILSDSFVSRLTVSDFNLHVFQDGHDFPLIWGWGWKFAATIKALTWKLQHGSFLGLTKVSVLGFIIEGLGSFLCLSKKLKRHDALSESLREHIEKKTRFQISGSVNKGLLLNLW